MATNTPINAPTATPVNVITGAAEFLNFVNARVPSLFFDHPRSTLDGGSVKVVNAFFAHNMCDIFVDCFGGAGVLQWKISGLVLRYELNGSVPENDWPKIVATLKSSFVQNERFASFNIEGHSFDIDVLIPPSSGLLLLHQLREGPEEATFRAFFDAVNVRDCDVCDQVDGKIYRIFRGHVLTSKGHVTGSGSAHSLTKARVEYNHAVVKIASAVASVDPEVVVHLRSNNEEDKLIDNTTQPAKRRFALLDMRKNGLRVDLPNVRSVLAGMQVDVSMGFKIPLTTVDATNFDHFRKFLFTHLEHGKNVLLRPRQDNANTTMILLSPRNMMARGVAGAVSVPATVTGLRSKIIQHPASRCLTAVSGAAMFDVKIRKDATVIKRDGDGQQATEVKSEKILNVMVFPSREVETALNASDEPGTIVDVLGVVRGLYSTSLPNRVNSDLFNRLLASLPVLPAGETPGFSDMFAVLCHNIDSLDALVDRFPAVDSAVGTALELPENEYFEATPMPLIDDNGNVIEEDKILLKISISYQCFSFLKTIGGEFDIQDRRPFVDFNVDPTTNHVSFTRRIQGDPENTFRTLKMLEYVVKCAVDNVLAQEGSSRANCAVDTLRMFVAPRQLRQNA